MLTEAEFKGTRAECFEFLKTIGFQLDGANGWCQTGWLATVMYANHGNFVGEVAGWDGPNFIARAWRVT